MRTQETRRAVVTGGGGFIGRALCRALLARGYQVTALTRGRARSASLSPDGPLPAFATWDGRTLNGWADLVDGAHVVVNLAGEGIADSRWTPERKRAILESRVFAGRAVAEAVARAARKPATVIQSSAVGYYGARGDEPLDESSPPGEGFLSEICLQWEESSLPVESLGVRRPVIRTGLALGRGGGVFEKILTPFKYYLGGAFGDGSQGFPWIHLEDVVEAILFLAENEDAAGPFNLTAPETTSNKGFCQELAKALSRPCGFSVPAAALKMAMGENMATELLLTGCRPFPRRLVEMGYVFKHPRLAGALKQLLSQQ